ncbi:MAG: hypothetical protein ABI422_06535 [Sphingomicrobium sp.]
MTRKTILLGFAAATMMAGPVSASGNAQSGATVGDCISDGFYGNEPNMANGAAGGPAEQAPGTNAGNVIPSQSPGPKVTNPDGSVRNGASVGDINQEFGGGALNAYCRATTGF